jgi:hypothetical protein
MKKLRRSFAVLAVAATAGALLVGSVGTALVLGLVDASAVGADPTVPYTDSNVVGYIGLCNQAGEQITSGTLSAAPFVWRAVSSQPAPAPYNGAGGTAILTAYLPLQGLPPGDWSGEQLTASSRYSNSQSPMAQATAKDVPLQDFVEDYPPKWDGFVQLRLLLGGQNEPADVQHYPALDLEISGDMWTAVGGGPVNCNAGSAESLETVVAPSPPSTTTTTGSSGPGGVASAATTVTSEASSAKRPTTSSDTSAVAAASHDIKSVAADQSDSWSGTDVLLLVVLILVVLSVLFIARRRRAGHVSSIISETSVKGPQP